MQCPVCGEAAEDLVDGACARCTSQRAAFLHLDPVMDALECAHCGRLFVGNSWRPSPTDRDTRVREIVRPNLTYDPRLLNPRLELGPRWEDEKNVVVDVRLSGDLLGHPVERAAETRVRFKNGACQDCSREMGGYFEAILQVRGSDGTDVDRLIPRIDDELHAKIASFRAQGRPGAFFTKVETVRGGGRDYYVGSHEIARILAESVAEAHGAERDESSKLVGRKDGRDLYRSTHLVRLPPYAAGDFVAIDEAPFKILSFDRRNLYLLDLIRMERVRREPRRLGPVRVIGRSHEERPAIVVSRSAGHAQVLDPITFHTVDVPLPYVGPQEEQVPVFRWQDHLYVVRDQERRRE